MRSVPLATTASSSAVVAFMAPNENLPARPVSLAAPRIFVCCGTRAHAVRERRRAARRAADAPRIEEAAAAAVVAVQIEGEHAGAFDEERPALGEERLEAAQVHDRGIGFDLPEVGIHRRRQRDARAQRVLQVRARRCAFASCGETSGLPGSAGCVFTCPTA